MKSRPMVACVCLAALPLAALLIPLAVENARLSRHTVSVTTASAVGGFVVAMANRLGKGRLNTWLRRADPRALVARFVSAVVSGLLYSVVHEFGHAIFAIALGGTVDSATSEDSPRITE